MNWVESSLSEGNAFSKYNEELDRISNKIKDLEEYLRSSCVFVEHHETYEPFEHRNAFMLSWSKALGKEDFRLLVSVWPKKGGSFIIDGRPLIEAPARVRLDVEAASMLEHFITEFNSSLSKKFDILPF
jgi:hypothetical protein